MTVLLIVLAVWAASGAAFWLLVMSDSKWRDADRATEAADEPFPGDSAEEPPPAERATDCETASSQAPREPAAALAETCPEPA